jgi:hypothetical protein
MKKRNLPKTLYKPFKRGGLQPPLKRYEMNTFTVLLLLILSGIFTMYGVSYAEETKPEVQEKEIQDKECRPIYGHFWYSSRWGWYGARKVVRTPVEAQEILEQIYLPVKGVKIARIRETPHYFQAAILNHRGKIVDLVIIDKRTGRIRSMY